jgi:hypothetical protein
MLSRVHFSREKRLITINIFVIQRKRSVWLLAGDSSVRFRPEGDSIGDSMKCSTSSERSSYTRIFQKKWNTSLNYNNSIEPTSDHLLPSIWFFFLLYNWTNTQQRVPTWSTLLLSNLPNSVSCQRSKPTWSQSLGLVQAKKLWRWRTVRSCWRMWPECNKLQRKLQYNRQENTMPIKVRNPLEVTYRYRNI